MNKIHLLFFILVSTLTLGQVKDVDSLKVVQLLEKADKHTDSLLQLKGYLEVLNLSKILNFDYGIYKSHYKIALWKRAKFNSDSAISQYKISLRDLKEKNTSKGLVFSSIGWEHANQSNYDSAQYYYNKQLKFGQQTNNNKHISRAYTNMGSMWHQQRKYEKSFEFYTKADSVLEQDENLRVSKLRANVYNYLGYSVRITHGYEKAIEYYLKAKEVHEQINNQLGVQEVNVAIAQAYTSFKEYDKALDLLNESIAYHQVNAPNSNSYSYSIIVRGYLLLKMKQYKKAEKDHLKFYELALSTSSKTHESRALGYLGNFYFETAEYNKSIEKYIQAIELNEDLNDLSRQIEFSKQLIIVYKKTNNHKKAVEYYDNVIALQNKFDANKIAEDTRRLETKYQTEKKEQTIAMLEAENELIAQKTKNQFIIFLGSLGIMFIAGFFIYSLYKNRKKTTHKLQELNRIKSNLFTNISHELRTPLTLISGPIEHQLSNNNLSKEDRDELVLVKQNANRLLNIVNQLMDLALLDSGELKLNVTLGNLKMLLEQSVSAFQYQADKKNIQISTNIKNLESVWFDSDSIEKIVYNLLSNAVKYAEPNSIILFEAHKEKNNLIITVINNSTDVNHINIANLFQRFYQNDATTEGVGVGLALVKELVNQLNGNVTASVKESDKIEFSVTLPIHKSALKTSGVKNDLMLIEKQPIENTLTNTNLIDELVLLIVEDDHDIRKFIRTIFQDQFKIIEADNGKVGIDKAIEHIPDLIISDVMMPITDGIELCNTLKNNQLTSHIPIVILTAKVGDEHEMKGLESGADAYVTKPFSVEKLKIRVQKLLEVREKLQKHYSKGFHIKPDLKITSAETEFLQRLQSTLNQHITDSNFTTARFTETMQMSRAQLHRKLKAIVNMTATEFIRTERLKLAIVLLKSSDANMSEIAYQIGFNSPSYFIKCFKEIYHCTPNEFLNSTKTS